MKAALTQAERSLVDAGLSVDALIAALVDHLRNLLILRTCGPDSTLVEVPGLAMDGSVGPGRAIRSGGADAGHHDSGRASAERPPIAGGAGTAGCDAGADGAGGSVLHHRRTDRADSMVIPPHRARPERLPARPLRTSRRKKKMTRP